MRSAVQHAGKRQKQRRDNKAGASGQNGGKKKGFQRADPVARKRSPAAPGACPPPADAPLFGAGLRVQLIIEAGCGDIAIDPIAAFKEDRRRALHR